MLKWQYKAKALIVIIVKIEIITNNINRIFLMIRGDFFTAQMYVTTFDIKIEIFL